MKRMKKVFFETEMTWKRVILVSLITGIAVGLLMIPEFLRDTSLQMPGVTYEFWILFALYIIFNCKAPLDAGLKTMVAFLISQPIIYLVQVPFSWQGWNLFSYYPTWFLITLATFPGGMLAWLVKKQNLLSVLILSLANAILCFSAAHCFFVLLDSFPRMLLSVIFMLAEIIFFILLCFPDHKKRLLAFLIAALLLAAGVTFQIRHRNNEISTGCFVEEGTPPYTVVSDNAPFDVTFRDSFLEVTYRPSELHETGDLVIRYEDADGNIYEVPFALEDDGISFFPEETE